MGLSAFLRAVVSRKSLIHGLLDLTYISVITLRMALSRLSDNPSGVCLTCQLAAARARRPGRPPPPGRHPGRQLARVGAVTRVGIGALVRGHLLEHGDEPRPHPLRAEAEAGQRAAAEALLLFEHAQQDVLGADVV